MLYARFDREKRRILANARFPSKQAEGMIYDSSEEIAFSDDMPLKVEGFYAVVAFKPSCILLSRDVIGGKPLYYSETEFSSFKRLIDGECRAVNPGEVVKIGYDGEVETLRYSFDEVFSPDPSPKDWGEVENLLDVVEKKLKEFKAGECIAFSGGVDSSLLAAMYDVPLISVTASDREEEYVRWAARELGRELHVFKFDEKTVKEVLPEVVRAIETPSPFHVSIGIPVYLSLVKAREMGYRSMMFGQGADELFGGYKKYENYSGEELFWILKKDVEMLGVNNLERDVKLSYRAEVNLMTPYLQWDIIRAVMKIPGDYKVRKVEGEVIRKYALRKIAERYLPREIAYRQKKAVQYSTKTAKLLEKIAGKDVKALLERML